MTTVPRWKIITILLICGFFTYASVPGFLSEKNREKLAEYMPVPTFNLGLDLRGGSHLLLELDTTAYIREQTENLLADIRSKLREEKVFYTGLRVTQGGVRFRLVEERNAPDLNIRRILQEVEPSLLVDTNDGLVSAHLGPAFLKEKTGHLVEQSIEIINRRVNESGTMEPIIQREGADRIVVQVPGLKDPEKLKSMLGKTAKMTFHLVNENVSMADALAGKAPLGTRILPGDDPNEMAPGQAMKYPVYSKVELSGDLLTNAQASFEQGQPVVAFKFNSLGAKKFGEISSKNVQKRFAVVLDEKVLTAPVIREPILGGSGTISGNFTVESANELAALLRAGALPAPLKVVEERSVGPSLGADSIEAGKMAGLVALVAIITFMFITYGLFGLFANIALILNIFMLLGAMALIGATLTMPGIAGIILTMGMAVDANVLIFERIREEVQRGRSPIAAVDHGFKGALNTIIDSNLTTVIAAGVMFFLGSGPIRGFAVTLTFGILASMFSAIFVTLVMIQLWLKTKRPKTITL